MLKNWSVLVFAVVAGGCADATASRNYPENTDLSGEWPVAVPQEQGFDPEQLALAYSLAREVEHLRGLLVLRNGYLVAEEYFAGSGPDSLMRIRSVTKSFMSTLVGIAIVRGDIASVDQTIGEFLVPEVVEDLDPAKRNITIEHLLTMSSGFEWDEPSGVEATKYAESGYDLIWRYTLDKPLVDEPGARFSYNSGAASLLSLVLTEAAGMNTLDYADQFLLTPLGIDTITWWKDGEYWYGGSHMRLRPRDMAKLGMLFVNQGYSNGTEIVPSDWITRSTTPSNADGLGFAYGPIRRMDYGYLWWIESGQSYDAFFAWGFGGQFVYCVPEQKLVVVTSTDSPSLTYETKDETVLALLDLVVEYVIPSLTSQ